MLLDLPLCLTYHVGVVRPTTVVTYHVGVVRQAHRDVPVVGAVCHAADLPADLGAEVLPGDDVLALQLPAPLGLAVAALRLAARRGVDGINHLEE